MNRSAAKVARVAAGEALARAAEGVGAHESEVGRLVQRLPDDPDTFRDHVGQRTSTAWNQSRSHYIERMEAEVSAAGERCMERVVSGMNACQNREQLNVFVKTRVRGIFNTFVTEVDAARAREWAALGNVMLTEVETLFRALYEDANFSSAFRTSDMLRLATPIPLANSISSLTDAVNQLINEAGANEVGGAAVGAIIGTILFPGIGTFIGGALGGAAGGSMNEDVPQKVYDRIFAKYGEIYDQVIDALNRDIAPNHDGKQPILSAIDDAVERERERFERLLRTEIARIDTHRVRAIEQAEGARGHVSEAAVWMARFDSMVQST